MKKAILPSILLAAISMMSFVNMKFHTDVFKVDTKQSVLQWYAEKLTGKHNGTIQLAGGESIIGHYVHLDKDMKIKCLELFPNLFANKKDWYFVSFTSDPVGDYSTGTNHGYHTFVGTEILRFTTAVGLASATYNIDCHALQCCHLHIQSGLASLMY